MERQYEARPWTEEDEAREAALREKELKSRSERYREQQKFLDNLQSSPRKGGFHKKRK